MCGARGPRHHNHNENETKTKMEPQTSAAATNDFRNYPETTIALSRDYANPQISRSPFQHSNRVHEYEKEFVPTTLPHVTELFVCIRNYSGTTDVNTTIDISNFIKSVKLPNLEKLRLQDVNCVINPEALSILRNYPKLRTFSVSNVVTSVMQQFDIAPFLTVPWVEVSLGSKLTLHQIEQTLALPSLRIVSCDVPYESTIAALVRSRVEVLSIRGVWHREFVDTIPRTVVLANILRRMPNLVALDVYANVTPEIYDLILAHPKLRYFDSHYYGSAEPTPEQRMALERKNIVVYITLLRGQLFVSGAAIERRVAEMKRRGSAFLALHGSNLLLPQKDGDHAIFSIIGQMLEVPFEHPEAKDYLYFW